MIEGKPKPVDNAASNRADRDPVIPPPDVAADIEEEFGLPEGTDTEPQPKYAGIGSAAIVGDYEKEQAEIEALGESMQLNRDQHMAAILLYLSRNVDEEGWYGRQNAGSVVDQLSIDTEMTEGSIEPIIKELGLQGALESKHKKRARFTPEGRVMLTALVADRPDLLQAAETYLDRSLRYRIIRLRREVNHARRVQDEKPTEFGELSLLTTWQELQAHLADLRTTQMKQWEAMDQATYMEMVTGSTYNRRLNSEDKQLIVVLCLDRLAAIDDSTLEASDKGSLYADDIAFRLPAMTGLSHKQAAEALEACVERDLVAGEGTGTKVQWRARTFTAVSITEAGRKLLAELENSRSHKLEAAKNFLQTKGTLPARASDELTP